MGSFNIKLKKSTYERLEKLRSSHKNHDVVINRALDVLATIEQMNASSDDLFDLPHGVLAIDPTNISDLKNTRIIQAFVDKKEIVKKDWHNTLKQMLIVATQRLDGSLSSLLEQYPKDLIRGKVKTQQFRPIDDLNISMRYLTATKTCKRLVDIANWLGIELAITLMWPEGKNSSFRGYIGQLHIRGR